MTTAGTLGVQIRPFDVDPKRQRAVFLNVPYDDAYQAYFVTLVCTLVCLGLVPRCVLEVREVGQGRLNRIFDLLRNCGASIHDLSRVGSPPRFNMPFELGIACALAMRGDRHEVVVIDRRPHRLDRVLSDYKGRDPEIYAGCSGLIDAVVDAFENDPRIDLERLRQDVGGLRRAAKALADRCGGTLFKRAAFRALIEMATEKAEELGYLR